MATTVEYGLGDFTFPRGWFMVADSDELGAIPLALRFFDCDLALYRGGSGQVVLLDAYCPHMGTHIARNTTSYVVIDGQIEGDSIRCPYHAWRFGPDGKCNDIPYHDGAIPASARIRSWPVAEAMGCIFVWHDPEGGEPDYDVPALEEWGDPAWVRWKIDRLGELQCHPMEIIDNIADAVHLGPIHGSTVEYYENEFRGHVAIQRQGGGHKTLAESGTLLQTDTSYTGPGVLLSRMAGLYDGIMFIAHTPIEDGLVKVWHGVLVKSGNVVATEEDVVTARGYQEAGRQAFAQDFEVWATKRPCIRVMQLRSDGPFDKARAWYRQFYNPRSEVAERQAQVDGVHQVRGFRPARAG